MIYPTDKWCQENLFKKKSVKIIATYLICRKIKGTQHLLYIPLLKYGALQTEQSDPTCAEMDIQELPKK